MTEEELEKLKALYKDKFTVHQIADKLGKTHGQIHHALAKNNLSRQRISERDHALVRAIRQYSDMYGIKKAAEKFSLTIDTIKNVRRRALELHKSLPDGYLVKLRERAYKYGLMKNMKQEAQDFASFCIIASMTSGNKINLHFAHVNYMRVTYGQLQHAKGRAKADGMKRELPIVEDFEEETPSVMVPAAEETQYSDGRIFRMANELGLDMIQRVIFILQYHYGLLLKEVGAILDKDMNWMCKQEQIIITKTKEEAK